MAENNIRETELQRKEAELELVIQEYYRYDMSGLKAEINRILESEVQKVDVERKTKLAEIERKFKTLHKLSAEHVSRGTRHKGQLQGENDVAADEKLLQDFERYSETYEAQVRESNLDKQKLRDDICKLEKEIREQRDLLANKQTENQNLNFLINKESELQLEKAQKEEAALRMLNDDLKDQLDAIDKQQDKTGGLVTPFRMETLLRNQYKTTIEGYEQFVTDSAQELDETQRALGQMTSQLEKERRITETLENEKRLNDEELERLRTEYNGLAGELRNLEGAFENKQSELDDLRKQAGDDARKLSVELCQAQKETNILVLEVKKYEGLHKFMDLERELILQAQKDAQGLNPAISAQDIEDAEMRQQELDQQVSDMTEEWQEKLKEVRHESEQTLNQKELKEFQTRIAILSRELTDKQNEIEQISSEKKKIEDTIDRTMDLEIDLKDQTEEIDVLNNRYRRALKDKVSVYDELMKAVQMLARRNAEYMGNEIEICRLSNLTSITKKELEQKEKIHQELSESIANHEDSAKLMAQADQQIAQKQSNIQELSNELYEKDKMIEQLNALLRQREANEQKMQMQVDEFKQDDMDPNDRIRKQKFAPQQIRGNAAAGGEQRPAPPRNDYVFERGSYAPQGVNPRDDLLDSRVMADLSEFSLPFPFEKICNDAEQGGGWWIFGTKCILVREYDDDLLMIREYKGHGDEAFNAYLANQIEAEYTKIQSLLRTTKQHLLRQNDPLKALSEEFIQIYKRELGLDE